MLKPLFGSVAFASMLVVNTIAFAQTPPAPAATPPAMGAPASDAGAAPMTKKQISKACLTQANEQKLKGKAKTAFRKSCVKNGGQAPT